MKNFKQLREELDDRDPKLPETKKSKKKGVKTVGQARTLVGERVSRKARCDSRRLRMV